MYQELLPSNRFTEDARAALFDKCYTGSNPDELNKFEESVANAVNWSLTGKTIEDALDRFSQLVREYVTQKYPTQMAKYQRFQPTIQSSGKTGYLRDSK